MDADERAHVIKLLTEHRRRLQVLEEQQAKFGIGTPPHIITEIEDQRAEIGTLEDKLDLLSAAPVVLFTYDSQATLPGTYILDWTASFPNQQSPAPDVWATKLLPELEALKQTINSSNARSIRLSQRAVLSAGFAFGYVFRAAARYKLWIEQSIAGHKTEWWSTSARELATQPLLHEHPSTVAASGDDTLIQLSISRTTQPLVDEWLKTIDSIGTHYRFEPAQGPMRSAVASGAHALNMAYQIGERIQRVRDERPHGTIHLLGALPFGLAVLIGTRLNKCGPIQCYDLEGSAYTAACLLR